MSDPEKMYLLELWEKNICPQCGEIIPESKRVGTGQKSDGGFCSLDCYAKFYELELVDRAKNVKRIMETIRNN